ncbi:Fe(3+) ABC transporter substrate-binding protein [Hyphomicrobium sp. CS1GBMeth3]|uniref:Fe(3+) ABC transporter substrate-binding protein n=1 Tax=Hyphomicrobium sp. CS1GBMeth3 TaxID=1892845 RepID=UPI00092FEE91|nr:Fe(3+) ABC transporter substrate-binding protein [Hyphomicrobium sp. CS1GBMeth3]
MILPRPFARAAASTFALLLSFAAFAGPAAPARAAEEVNVYSYREPGLTDPIFKTFEKETGIKVNVIYAKDGLIERITEEGRNSPADIVLTPESGLLIRAKDAGITQALKSKVLDEAIDAKLRDPEGHWFALTQRARVVYASKERVKQDQITYEELADPKWKGKICVRSGQHTYNIALIASIIAHDGEEKAEAWLTGLRDNLARKPAGGDREGVRDIHAGLCDLAIANTYYMAAMLKNPDQKPWAESVRILFPNAADRGTHVNVSGAALAAHAPNRDNAVKLIEYLVSPEAQGLYAEANGEYPVLATAKTSDLVKSWGELKPDSIPLSEFATLRKKASELVDKVRFDAGPSS